MEYQGEESDVLNALNDIYSDLKEASMNFQTHYGVTLPFSVPSSYIYATGVCLYVYVHTYICMSDIFHMTSYNLYDYTKENFSIFIIYIYYKSLIAQINMM